MKNFVTFLAGMISAFVVLGGAGYFLLVGSESGFVKPNDGKALSLPQVSAVTPPPADKGLSPATVKSDAGTGYLFDGTVLLPPLLRERVEKKTAQISVRIFLRNPGSPIKVGFLDVAVPASGFPFRYQIPVENPFVLGLSERTAVNLRAFVRICFGALGTPCELETLPSVTGWASAAVAPITGADKRVTLKMPPVVMALFQDATDASRCSSQNSSMTFSVQPTAEFLKDPSHPSRLAVLAVPNASKTRKAPYFMQTSRAPISLEELQQSGSAVGVSWAVVNLTGSEAVPFKLGAPGGQRFSLYAHPCSAGQSDDECAAAAFPIDAHLCPARQETSNYRLVPKGLESPGCDSVNQLVYLHRWVPSEPTQASLEAARPAELLSGACY